MLQRKQKQPMPKTVRGEAADQQVFKDAIAAAVLERGFSKPRQIALDLGRDGTREERHNIAQTMANMRQAGWLMRDHNGVYSVSPTYEIRTGRISLEDAVVAALRELGGMARASEILDLFDAKPSACKDNAYSGRSNSQTRRIYHALETSKHIARLEIPKVTMWALSHNERLKEPLTGRSADFFLRFGFLQAVEHKIAKGGKRAEANLYERIKEHYDLVGMAFQRLRTLRECDPYEAVKDQRICDALEAMRQAKPGIANQAFSEIRAMVEREATEKGKSTNLPWMEKRRSEEFATVHAHLLTIFESGDAAMHYYAPAEFYRAFAARLDACPASLSRGCVIPVVIGITKPVISETQEAIEVAEMEKNSVEDDGLYVPNVRKIREPETV